MIKTNKQIDKENILRLFKIVSPTQADMELIFKLYKKYVEPNAINPRYGGCNSCGNSIVTYWKKLSVWYMNNSDKLN